MQNLSMKLHFVKPGYAAKKNHLVNPDFQQTLDRINLNNQGTIISYLYNTESLAKRNPFNSTEIIKSNNGNHGLLLYKR